MDSVTVIDARSPGEYAGTDVRADRGGHIPEAINIDWVYNNTGEGNKYVSHREELKEFYDRELSAIGTKKLLHTAKLVYAVHIHILSCDYLAIKTYHCMMEAGLNGQMMKHFRLHKVKIHE